MTLGERIYSPGTGELTLGRVPGNIVGFLSWVQLLSLLVLVAITIRLLCRKMKKR